MARIKEQQIVLPTYRLDSNLVLLPGIIYNVTFSRFKAAALLYRFKDQVSLVSVIKNLLAEYNFDNSDNQTADDPEEVYSNPTVISRDAVKGIAEFYRGETNFTSGTQLGSSKELVTTKPQTEFDWLTLAIKPNLTKIKDPENSPVDPNETNNVVTVVRIVGIIDDVTNIKLTLQGITRASTVKDTKTNESLFEIDWREKVEDLRAKFTLLRKNSYKLFKRIDDFIVAYRQALTANGSNGNNTNSTKKNLGRSKLKKDNGDLLTLNPLANAFYLQLVGSKDFTKAFISLQNLYGQFSVEDPKHKIDSKSYLRLIDLTSGILPFPNNEKLRLLNKLQIPERSDQINLMINQLITIFDNLLENNSFVNHWFYNEASNIQKANVVANQLKSIRLVLEGMTNKEGPKPLSKARLLNNDNKNLTRRPTSRIQDEEEDEDDDDGDDDLKAITNFIKNKLPNISGLSSDSKRLIVKDYKRIRSNSQPGGGGNSDFHVIRNYLEIVMDIPWDKFVTKFANNKDIDLKLAKDQLDNDHYGLSHVKRRLIQYLVVLKLLGLNAEKSIENFKNDNNITDLQPNETESSKKSIAPSSTSSSIIIANNDETSNSHKQAQNKVKTSISESNLEQETDESIQISKNNKSPIIMLTGPPGTGKTSLAKSIAKSLGRNFQRISLGGIKDESEIRGHRRTYIGSMPGLIVQALRKSRSMNPVILLDEIDKVVGGNSGGNKFNGDPSAALLEVLDPEQNNSFIDHYLGFPIDLSQVIFICTSNEPHLMSRPLLDRLEMIEVGAYDYNEKLIIGKKYLLPRQIKRNGFPNTDNQSEYININPATFKKIIVDYTREAGVRNLERRLATICRFKAVEYCETLGTDKSYNPTIDVDDLPRYLGVPYSSGDLSSNDTTISSSSRVGIVNGLSYNSEGSGSVLVFESIGFDKRVGNPNSTNTGCSLTMTGRLGEVLLESGKIGLIYIKLLIYKNLLSTKDKDERYLIDKFNNLEINLHVPMGSISKDGPSAGVTMALLFLSVLLDKPVPGDIAMTGEITLRGLVLPIGGVKEKMMGAHLNGTIKRMIVPRENRKDLIEEYSRRVEEEGTLDTSLVNELLKDNENTDFKLHQVEEYFLEKYGIQFFYAKEFSDIMRIVWGDEGALVNLEYQRMVEYHL